MIGSQVPPPGFLEKLEARVPITRSTISTHLVCLTHTLPFLGLTLNAQDYIEEQLSDGRTWLFDTAVPGYADVAARGVHYLLHVFAYHAVALDAPPEVRPAFLDCNGG